MTFAIGFILGLVVGALAVVVLALAIGGKVPPLF